MASPWEVRPQRDSRVAWAWFTVGPVDPEAVDRAYLRALLLDYGAVEEPEAGLAGRLRDYVVRVVPEEDELLLGQAYVAVGRRRVAVGWFALEPLGPREERAHCAEGLRALRISAGCIVGSRSQLGLPA